jgi:hypothetical protein
LRLALSKRPNRIGFFLPLPEDGNRSSFRNIVSSHLLSKNRIYKTIILPVVLYGCETWSLTLREEHRLRVFENRVPRRIFGQKRDEVMGE